MLQRMLTDVAGADSDLSGDTDEDPWPIAEVRDAFRRRYFPDCSTEQWNDWRWQTRSRLRNFDAIARIFELSADERDGILHHKGSLPAGITPYYASLMSRTDPEEALRRTHLPVRQEFLRTRGEADDPLGEDHDAVVPGLIHRYPDRPRCRRRVQPQHPAGRAHHARAAPRRRLWRANVRDQRA